MIHILVLIVVVPIPISHFRLIRGLLSACARSFPPFMNLRHRSFLQLDQTTYLTTIIIHYRFDSRMCCVQEEVVRCEAGGWMHGCVDGEHEVNSSVICGRQESKSH